MTTDIARLKADVCDFIDRGGSDERFNELALALFRWHIAEIPLYRGYCERRSHDLGAIDDYRKIPPLPVEASKYAELSCWPSRQIVHRFSTSGTTQNGRGDGRRGISPFDRDALQIMDLAVEHNGAANLFPDGVKCRIFVLAPRPSDAPHMIMVHGMRHLMSVFGDDRSDFFAGKQGLELDRLFAAIEGAIADAVPVCLIGASFAFVHLLDAMSARGKDRLRLPPRSRLMDAGGYKGRSRELAPETFRELVGAAFDLPDFAMVNLLGMTELSSQVYDNSFVAAHRGVSLPRCKVPPPWMRTRVGSVDDPMVDAPSSEPGFLVHYDLANFSRPFALISDDLGWKAGDGFSIQSRVKSSEPRGCSVSVDELWRHA